MPRRYAVYGNCQAAVFATCLQLLRPDAKVEMPDRKRIVDWDAMIERDQLKTCDLVFVQPTREQSSGALVEHPLVQRLPRVVVYPCLMFRGFHPDEINLLHDGRGLPGPVGAMHSIVATAAFLEGLPPERAHRLFNRFVFATLGYFDEYERSFAFLKQVSERIGFPLPAAELRALGTFMHTPIHPTTEAVAIIATAALHKAGEDIEPETWRGVALPRVLGRMSQFAVYPEIARHLGLERPLPFALNKRRAVAVGKRTLDLIEFIRAAYEILGSVPAASLDAPAVTSAREVLRAAGLR